MAIIVEDNDHLTPLGIITLGGYHSAEIMLIC